MNREAFRFKQFRVYQDKAVLKIGTDGCLMGAWALSDFAQIDRILDVGCGTGIIALMLAQRFPEAAITGLDISRTAFEQSQENFSLSPWKHRLKAVHTDLQSFSPEDQFDAIVSNPPFYNRGLLSGDSEKDLARHDDALPLSELMTHSSRILRPHGILSLILPAERQRDAEWEASLRSLYLKRCCVVYPGPGKEATRVMVEFEKEGVGESEFDELCIEAQYPNSRSLNFWRLMNPFYLDF